MEEEDYLLSDGGDAFDEEDDDVEEDAGEEDAKEEDGEPSNEVAGSEPHIIPS